MMEFKGGKVQNLAFKTLKQSFTVWAFDRYSTKQNLKN